MIFVDSGAFFALYVRSDEKHVRARAWLDANAERLMTTDYVAVETLNLLIARRQFAQALTMNHRFLSGKLVRLEWVSRQDYEAAADIFDRFRDKGWSFTDCTSRVVMERLGIGRAFAFDEHFRQFGPATMVP